MTHTRLRKTGLTHARLTHTLLSKTGLTHARLPKTGLTHTLLTHTRLLKTGLSHARLAHARLSKTGLTHARLTKARRSAELGLAWHLATKTRRARLHRHAWLPITHRLLTELALRAIRRTLGRPTTSERPCRSRRNRSRFRCWILRCGVRCWIHRCWLMAGSAGFEGRQTWFKTPLGRIVRLGDTAHHAGVRPGRTRRFSPGTHRRWFGPTGSRGRPHATNLIARFHHGLHRMGLRVFTPRHAIPPAQTGRVLRVRVPPRNRRATVRHADHSFLPNWWAPLRPETHVTPRLAHYPRVIPRNRVRTIDLP